MNASARVRELAVATVVAAIAAAVFLSAPGSSDEALTPGRTVDGASTAGQTARAVPEQNPEGANSTGPDGVAASARLAVAGAPAHAETPPRLRGAVVSAEGGALSGARVRPVFAGDEPVTGASGWTTDEGGRFDGLAPVGSGPYVLSVAHKDMAGRRVLVRTDEDARVVLHAGGALEGTLRDNQGRPLAGTVHVLAEDWEDTAVAGEDGRFRVAGLAAGVTSLLARAPGFVPCSGEAFVEANRVAQVDLVATQGQTLRVRARLESGLPAAGAEATIEDLGAFSATSTTANDAGELVFAGLAPGELKLIVSAAGQSAGPLAIYVPMGADPEPLDLQLQANPYVVGLVYASDGAPIRGARIQAASGRDPSRDPTSTTSGADGSFALGPLPSGDTWVTILAAGFAKAELPCRVSQGMPKLEVTLVQAGHLRGVAIGVDGTPARDALVTLAELNLTTRTDADGRFAFSDLPPGTAHVVARSDADELARADVDVVAGEERELTLTLAAGRTLAGTVRGATGAPLAATVVLDDPDLILEAGSNAEGRFSLTLPAGARRVFVTAPRHVPASVEVPPAGELDVTLAAERIITGEVRDASGEPVTSFAVARAEAPGHLTWFRGGRFSLQVDTSTRELIVRPTPSGHHHGEADEAPALAPVRVPLTSDTVRVTLPAGREAEGHVVDALGNPVAGAAFLIGHVREEDLFGPDANEPLAMSEEGGLFHAGGMPQGGLDVTISHPEHAPLHTRLAPGEGLRVALPPEGRVSGVARGADGQGAEGVPIVLEGPSVRRGTSGPGGTFRFRGLAAGDYTVTRVDTEATTRISVRAGAETRAEF